MRTRWDDVRIALSGKLNYFYEIRQHIYLGKQVEQFVPNIIIGNQNVRLFGWLMVFDATFNNISFISWWSVLQVEETGVPGENHRPAASY